MEEARLERLASAEFSLPYQELLEDSRSPRDVSEGSLATAGRALWRSAVRSVQSGTLVDDRALYWARLHRKAGWRASVSADALAAFERTSRGMDDAHFSADADYRVLVTGFDPFHLDVRLDQSNPSGLAALALDGRTLQTERGAAHIQAAVFPVRFADFDAGMVEDFVEPHLLDGVDLVITISMGRDDFDLERFPGRRRSAAVTDNLNVLTGADEAEPLVPLHREEYLEGPEFLEFTLPAATMAAVAGRFGVRDNRNVQTLEQGEFEAPDLETLSDQTAVRGSGGGYLSNEIAYRTLLANRRLLGDGAVPMGHIHTPRLQGFDPVFEAEVLSQIEAMLLAALAALPPGG